RQAFLVLMRAAVRPISRRSMQMTERKRLGVIEKTLLIAFAGLLVYFAATGALSLSGLDHHWPYPSR
ncbi:hypothetical protein K5M45_01360, partial [Serratia marcescens]